MKTSEPTDAFLVEAALKEGDDFLTQRELVSRTKLPSKVVHGALIHLRHYLVASAIDVEGTLWWYHTPDTDVRSRTVAERTPPDGPIRRRKERGKGASTKEG